jgi:hypothetical protein
LGNLGYILGKEIPTGGTIGNNNEENDGGGASGNPHRSKS